MSAGQWRHILTLLTDFLLISLFDGCECAPCSGESQPKAVPVLSSDPNDFALEVCGLNSGIGEGQAGWTSGVELRIYSNGDTIYARVWSWEEVDRLQDNRCCFRVDVPVHLFSEGISTVVAAACAARRCDEHVVLTEDDTLLLSTQNPSRFELVLTKPQTDLHYSEDSNAGFCGSVSGPLSRTTMCETISHFPFEPKTADCSRTPKTEGSGGYDEEADTLILYVFSHSSDGWREDNFFFFLAFGIPHGRRYHTLIIVNGELDASWDALLTFLSNTLPNFEWMHRSDVGRDICAWRQVLMGELKHRVPITRYKRFILTNASIRGPFLPSFFREPWPELYYSLLNNQTRLAGGSVNCMCGLINREGGGRGEERGIRRPYPVCNEKMDQAHVQSYLLAFEKDLLPLVSSLSTVTCLPYLEGPMEQDAELAADLKQEWLQSVGRTAGPDSVFSTTDAILETASWRAKPPNSDEAFRAGLFERYLTPEMVRAGLNVAVTQYLFRDVDMRDTAELRKLCQDSLTGQASSDMLFPSAYAGIDVHPLELIFFKTNRKVAPEVLAQMTRFTLLHSQLQFPLSFCWGS